MEGRGGVPCLPLSVSLYVIWSDAGELPQLRRDRLDGHLVRQLVDGQQGPEILLLAVGRHDGREARFVEGLERGFAVSGGGRVFPTQSFRASSSRT